MNRKILSIGIFIILCVFTFQSCKKDRTTVIVQNPTNNTNVSKLNVLGTFTSAAPALQTFNLVATNGGWITGVKGCKFYFPANALLDKNNNPVTGNVTIELKEFMNKADMLFSGVTVTSGNQLLESGGMFYIMAKQNGEELHLKNNVGFQMMVPQADNGNNPMDFWNGVANDSSLNKVDWEKVDSVVIEKVKDSAQGGGGGARQSYFGYFDYFKFGYCNIDREAWKFSTIINKFRIKLPNGCKDTNSTALLLFKNYNCCAWCNWITAEDMMSTGYQLPLGETIKVLVYKKTGSGEDDLAYAVLEITLVDNTLADFSSVPLIPCTNQQLEDVIKAL
jgi:hypothetical protein